jgi:predicted phosphate transport protein (TIGR00153 family)
MRSFVSLFGKSPFGPLSQHAERVCETVSLIDPLFESFLQGQREETRKLYEQISKLEHKADIIKNDIRDHLPKSLLMPVDRGDVLLFLKEQDRLADRAEDLGVILTMRATPAPETLRPSVRALVAAVLEAANEWFGVAAGLPELEDASFADPEVARVMQQIKRISDLEWEADKRQAEAGTTLFEHERELDPVSVVVWMRIHRVLGSVADHAENTADLLRVMLAKR